MWDHLTSGDIERAKQSLSSRRAETNARHAEETKGLEAKQADEINSLNAKEAEIELVNKLINDFTREFVHPAGTSSEGAGATMTPLAETMIESDAPGKPGMLEKGTAAPPISSTEALQVQYAGSNFGRVRKFA